MRLYKFNIEKWKNPLLIFETENFEWGDTKKGYLISDWETAMKLNREIGFYVDLTRSVLWIKDSDKILSEIENKGYYLKYET